ncbi:MAG: branched-chain-amino-acid transaminase [Spirochaetaceae bacterium]|jgi:branched-chain amino acid aminotransferase|nr:branched-chain-amino-acid transaminase [Spirochaetaceae bacterium]
MAFSLNSYPVIYRAKFSGSWKEEFIEKPHKTPAQEDALPEAEREQIIASRNYFDDMPLVSYSTQYGLGVFEGLKAFPQKDGSLAIFRPDKNAARFRKSMEGLYMPPFPEDMFLKACLELARRNAALGFAPVYKPEWEKDSFSTADAVYIRPFTYSEGGVGVKLSSEPWVMVVCTTVGAYFETGLKGAVVSDRIRAAPNGTGWIKAASNYVISALAKHEAAKAGFMECVFLDAVERSYVEEGSSCNIFFYLKSGELVTPELGDTILPGITRESIILLARGKGVRVVERRISIGEAMSESRECFVSGTAAGATPVESLTHKGKTVEFSGGAGGGAFTMEIRDALKAIQYGKIAGPEGWMLKV